MNMKNYEELSAMHIDVLGEIGNIGAGNAAAALSKTLDREIDISVPVVKIMEYNAAIRFLGDPESIQIGILVMLKGDIKGIVLYLLELDFVNTILQNFGLEKISDLFELDEISKSAVTEVGNIIIASYVNAISEMAGMKLDVSVPAIAIDMLGSIASIPMIEYGYESNSIMMIDVQLTNDNVVLPSSLILVPEINSISYLFEKLGMSL